MTESADDVVIRISRSKALALFEWAQRFMETQDQRFTHPADAIAIDSLATELEWALPEVFTDAYPGLLAECRVRVEAEYRQALGPSGAAWLAKLDYQDVPADKQAEPGAGPAGGSM
jgi:hypothetical protein